MESRINYIALLIVITLGVVAGNLISNWITMKFVESEIEEFASEISEIELKETQSPKQTSKNKAEPVIAKDSANEEQLMQQRKIDDVGLRLAKNCSEWRVAHEDMQTQTSKRGMTKHCDQYQKYIETGELPPLKE